MVTVKKSKKKADKKEELIALPLAEL